MSLRFRGEQLILHRVMGKANPFGHRKKDPVMKSLIEKHGELKLVWETDVWEDLVDSIISQQLSDKAAATIGKRFRALFGKKFPRPGRVLAITNEKIRACGLSWSKVSYIKNIAEAIETGKLVLEKLGDMENEEVMTELTKIKGVGQWTAEMTLMFSLFRPDVFSLGDAGLRAAVAKLYKVEKENLKEIARIAEKWRPHRSLAARYLWKSLER